LEVGGTVPANGRVVEEPIEQDFELPPDVDPLAVALAIDAKLRHGQKASPGIGDDPMQLLERRAGGSFAGPLSISGGVSSVIPSICI
jgi:hypothetical protein